MPKDQIKLGDFPVQFIGVKKSKPKVASPGHTLCEAAGTTVPGQVALRQDFSLRRRSAINHC